MLKKKACCFFGHRDTHDSIRPRLRLEIQKLILDEGVTEFYVGTNGNFDMMVYQVLKKIKEVYPQIEYTVVLAYINDLYRYDKNDNVYQPEELNNVPNRAAIPERNNWMISHSDYVICYIDRNTGGAAKFVEKAIKKGLKIVRCSD